MGLPYSHVFVDSLVIINWENKKASLASLEMVHWCDHIRSLMSGFTWLNMRHVYREHNQSADSLSKEALLLSLGLLSFSEIMNGTICMNGNLKLF